LADEDRMGTRFQDLHSATYLIIGGSHGIDIDLRELSATRDPLVARASLNSMLPVSGERLCSMMDEAAEATLASAWEPQNRLLRFSRPVQVSEMKKSGLNYDPWLGLIEEEFKG